MPSFNFHPGFGGNSLRCNPWDPTQFVIAASENFGVAGSGKVYIVNTSAGFQPGTPVSLAGCWGTSDCAFDACFSATDANTVAVACGDGVKIYNISHSSNSDAALPALHLTEHRAEVSSVTWSQSHLFSCSWDGSVKLYSAASPQSPAMTYREHLKEVYEVSPAPSGPSAFLSCSGDGTWKLWDARAPRSVLTQVGHDHQILLSVDWCALDPNVFATGGVDRAVRLWDVRRPAQPLAALPGHRNACRRVRFAPHARALLASAGYDFTVCVWDLAQPQRPLAARYTHHREFVVGLEWSRAAPQGIASAAWDGRACFWVNGTQVTLSPQPQALPAAVPPPRAVVPRTAALPGLPQPPPPLPPKP